MCSPGFLVFFIPNIPVSSPCWLVAHLVEHCRDVANAEIPQGFWAVELVQTKVQTSKNPFHKGIPGNQTHRAPNQQLSII